MPLNPSEKTSIAQALLRLFGEDSQACGRTCRYLQDFSNTDLLAALLAAATTWPVFIDSGLSIQAWKDDVTRIYNLTQTT